MQTLVKLHCAMGLGLFALSILQEILGVCWEVAGDIHWEWQNMLWGQSWKSAGWCRRVVKPLQDGRGHIGARGQEIQAQPCRELIHTSRNLRGLKFSVPQIWISSHNCHNFLFVLWKERFLIWKLLCYYAIRGAHQSSSEPLTYEPCSKPDHWFREPGLRQACLL